MNWRQLSKKVKKPVAVAKQGFEYFHYKNRESFKGLKMFCAPYYTSVYLGDTLILHT